MGVKPKKIRVRTKKTAKPRQDCLNLRDLEKKRRENIMAQSVGVIDLPKLTAKQRALEQKREIQQRKKLREAARHLLDLRRERLVEQPDNLESEAMSVPEPAWSVEINFLENNPPDQPRKENPILPATRQAPADRLENPAGEQIFPEEVFEVAESESSVSSWSRPADDSALETSRAPGFNFLTPAETGPDAKSRRRFEAVDGFWSLQRQIIVAARSPRRRAWRSLTVFAVLIFLLAGSIGASAALQRTLDSQGVILAKASAAAGSLKTAAANIKQQKFVQAISDFERSAQYFNGAKEDIAGIGALTSQLLRLVPKGRSAVLLVEAGQELSRAGESFTTGLSRFKDLGSIFSASADGHNLGEALSASRTDFDIVSDSLSKAEKNLEQVSLSSLPANFHDDFNEAKEIVQVMQGATDYFLKSSQQLAGILGVDSPKRYLVLLANSDEARGALGGFPGSYLLLDCEGGRIKKLEFHDIYEIRGQSQEAVAPPKQLQLITGNFEIQDAAGWFLDYRTTAQKAMEYYQLSDVGTTVDGVFTVSSEIIPDLLKVTGPIALPQYNLAITQENYLSTIENEVESKEARLTNQPKKIVETFFNNLLSKLLTQKDNNWLSMLEVLNTALSEKKIMLYFSDAQLQEFAYQNNAAGELKDADNYLAVYSYNIGGGKTDRDISEEIRQVSSLDLNGTIKNQVEITRTHKPQDQLSSIKNVSWVRVVLPAEAEVREVVGFETPFPTQHPAPAGSRPDPLVADIENSVETRYNGQVWLTQEEGKKVVGYWQSLEPGMTKTSRVVYDLPRAVSLGGLFNQAAGLTSLIQVQPGKHTARVSGQVYFPPELKLSWQEGRNALVNNGFRELDWIAERPLGDIVVSAVWERK